jgi:hypothetical protein
MSGYMSVYQADNGAMTGGSSMRTAQPTARRQNGILRTKLLKSVSSVIKDLVSHPISILASTQIILAVYRHFLHRTAA